ncbi:uncharacterized protein TOT_010000448 [Theileria orientalis strain Shintoku]|uniref:riboflavin kinase n=1 Tax=Theileria orientalis strain Shintoku TaxID=869250 RepID=J4C7G2_THEOR|nr:uncharacterized protein TOT_010000448 [Theileria orientalis strain Shintoku]BAM38983.1 uncharacterized protein TOT_010000448 [Theileria orientalis strain Shintoku]|eukprot:XP_009689284.1 uncharacterized protein TOT_010000448 [Theileria orientalis strain Shintoku]
MTNLSNCSKILNTYLIIDSDDLFFNYKSCFINLLGTIANAIEDNLISPWNISINDTTHTNTNTSNHNILSQSIRDIIRLLLKLESLDSKHINDTLAILSKILNKNETATDSKLNSLCNIFNNASLYSIFVENNKFVKKYNKKLNYVNVAKLINFVYDLVLLGFYNNTSVFEGYNCTSSNGKGISTDRRFNNVDFTICELISNRVPSKCKFIFVTSLPSVLAEFLTIKEFLPAMSKCCTIVSHLDEVPQSVLKSAFESYKIVSTNDSFISKVKERNNCSAFLQMFNSNQNVVKSMISRPNYRKVDLLSRLDSDVTGTIGSYLQLSNKITLIGTVFPGNGRGWPLLGIPTANLRCENVPHLITGNIGISNDVAGVYIGYAYVAGNSEVARDRKLDAIVSIGFNPHFFGENYSIETYLYHEFRHSLLDQQIHLTIEGYLRTDSKFDSLESLIQAIQQDLHLHKAIMDATC